MIPQKNKNIDFEIVRYPSKTYKLNDNNKIYNYVDGLEAIKQAVYKILSTERYEYMVYSWNYGFEVEDLIGEPYNYVVLELKDRITEALLQDDRIEELKNFRFSKNFDSVICSFEVKSIYGEFNSGFNLKGVL